MATKLQAAIEAMMPSIADLFADIASASKDTLGITRDAYGEKETTAAECLIAYAKSHGLAPGYDSVGNLNVTLPGAYDKEPELLIGSHLDSVPRGGNYDGLAGIVGGIAVLSAFRQADISPKQAIRVFGFRGEESPWFGTAYLGSKLLLGQLKRTDLDELRRKDTGKTLAEHMTALGLTPSTAANGSPAISLGRAKSYLELHIEQGPLLEALGCPIGLATAIRGNIRYPFAKCHGAYAHSAAVPRHLRSDAVLATAKLLSFADDRWRCLIEAGNDDLVFTCGIFQTNSVEQAMTKVPGEVSFTLNIGGIKDAVMADLHDSIMARAGELASEHHVRFEFGSRVGTPAVDLDGALMRVGAAMGTELGIPTHPMATVGHDAAIFARFGIPAGVILIRNANGSHNPDEDMALSDFALGVKILALTALNL